jgi:hypothetical protein
MVYCSLLLYTCRSALLSCCIGMVYRCLLLHTCLSALLSCCTGTVYRCLLLYTCWSALLSSCTGTVYRCLLLLQFTTEISVLSCCCTDTVQPCSSSVQVQFTTKFLLDRYRLPLLSCCTGRVPQDSAGLLRQVSVIVRIHRCCILHKFRCTEGWLPCSGAESRLISVAWFLYFFELA